MQNDIFDLKQIRKSPNSKQPLAGLNILLLEDSRYFAEAVRLMSVASGARLRRAVSLTTARRHLRTYLPDVVLVDLGLPDGSGIELIKELSHRPCGGPVTIAISGSDDGAAKTASLEAGAKCFLSKPMKDLVSFQQVILSVLPKEDQANTFRPRIVGDTVNPNTSLLSDDLAHIQDMLAQAGNASNKQQIAYGAQFLRSVARASQDHELLDAATSLSAHLQGGERWQNQLEVCVQLVKKRIQNSKFH